MYSTDGTRLAIKSNGQTVYYRYNSRDDVVVMTNQDKEVVATYEYDSWGNVLKSDTKGIAADNPFGYAGYMYDKEMGMYYLIARYYNPDYGVFLSVDPDPGDEDDLVTQNGYTYADNNPAMLTDPYGHFAQLLIPVDIRGARMAAPHVGRFVAKKLVRSDVKKQFKGRIPKQLNFKKHNLFEEHYGKHVIRQQEFGKINRAQYLQGTCNLLNAKPNKNILVKKRQEISL